MCGLGFRIPESQEIVVMSFRINRRALIASLALAPVMAKAGPAFALTDQQELVDKARITFDKLITALEFGELPYGVGRRPRHELVEFVEGREALRQGVEGQQLRLCHVSCFGGVGQASQRSSPAVTNSSSLSSG